MISHAQRRLVVLETRVLIDLLILDQLGLLRDVRTSEFVVSDSALRAITLPDHRQRLRVALDAHWLDLRGVTGIAALTTYAALRMTLGRGEAACIALAEELEATIACDYQGACRIRAMQRLGADRVVGTSHILDQACSRGLLSCRELSDATKRLSALDAMLDR